jgi:hypothetical protein
VCRKVEVSSGSRRSSYGVGVGVGVGGSIHAAGEGGREGRCAEGYSLRDCARAPNSAELLIVHLFSAYGAARGPQVYANELRASKGIITR